MLLPNAEQIRGPQEQCFKLSGTVDGSYNPDVYVVSQLAHTEVYAAFPGV